MGLGKQVRLSRIFSHPTGRLCSIAIDHYMVYNLGLPPGLAHMKHTLATIMAAQPDAVTMHRGIALSLWGDYVGQAGLILQTSGVRPDDTSIEQFNTVEDGLRIGADAVAIVAFLRGPSEARYLKAVADFVTDGMRHEMPVICHAYPRDPDLNIIHHPEDIAWTVHCLVELGVDVVKVPYCGDPVAHAQIVADCPVPIVAAGGPKTNTLRDALQIMSDAVDAGVLGGTVGRNVWSDPNISGAVRAYKAVIHDRTPVDQALALMGT